MHIQLLCASVLGFDKKYGIKITFKQKLLGQAAVRR